MTRWWILAWVFLLAGCATGTPVGPRLAGSTVRHHHFVAEESPAGKPPVATREARTLARASGGGSGPAALVARTALGAVPPGDAF